MNTPTEIYITVPAVGHVKTPEGTAKEDLTIGLYWTLQRPSEITLHVTHTDGVAVPWRVARSTFLAGAQDWARGAWIGVGDFGLCYSRTADTLMLSFRPHDTGERGLAVLTAAPVEQFINHSYRVGPHACEEEINILAVDRALERMLP